MNGQCEVKLNGRTYHARFGINAIAEFLGIYGVPLAEMPRVFAENKIAALRDMFFCGLKVGDTRRELPEDFDPVTFGNWLDDADEKVIKTLTEAYLSSKVLGKQMGRV